VNVSNNNTLTDEIKINLNMLGTLMLDMIGGGDTTTGDSTTLVPLNPT
jgi:hypothetical protein